MHHYGVSDSFLEEITFLFRERQEAEEVVAEWDRDAPEQAGLLTVVEVDFEVSVNGRRFLRSPV